MPPAAYVLQDFAADEEEEVGLMLEQAIAAIETILHDDIETAMNRHNGVVSEED
jgi:peptidyl-tRNA hydrolase